MNVVVIEDERLIGQRLIALIERYDSSINVLAQIPSVKDAISWFSIARTDSVDLIFMDIHLEDGDSFQIIDQLRLTTPIIFTTAFDEYMIKAFKVNSIDYLLKPVNYDELAAAIEKFRSLRATKVSHVDVDALIDSLAKLSSPSFKERFMVTVGTKIRPVATENIAYFYLEEKTVLLVTNDSTTLPIDYSLDKLMSMVNPDKFFRVNRQFIVSFDSIHMVYSVSAGKLRLDLIPKTKHEVSVSGDRIADFKRWLGKD